MTARVEQQPQINPDVEPTSSDIHGELTNALSICDGFRRSAAAFVLKGGLRTPEGSLSLTFDHGDNAYLVDVRDGGSFLSLTARANDQERGGRRYDIQLSPPEDTKHKLRFREDDAAGNPVHKPIADDPETVRKFRELIDELSTP